MLYEDFLKFETLSDELDFALRSPEKMRTNDARLAIQKKLSELKSVLRLSSSDGRLVQTHFERFKEDYLDIYDSGETLDLSLEQGEYKHTSLGLMHRRDERKDSFNIVFAVVGYTFAPMFIAILKTLFESSHGFAVVIPVLLAMLLVYLYIVLAGKFLGASLHRLSDRIQPGLSLKVLRNRGSTSKGANHDDFNDIGHIKERLRLCFDALREEAKCSGFEKQKDEKERLRTLSAKESPVLVPVGVEQSKLK